MPLQNDLSRSYIHSYIQRDNQLYAAIGKAPGPVVKIRDSKSKGESFKLNDKSCCRLDN